MDSYVNDIIIHNMHIYIYIYIYIYILFTFIWHNAILWPTIWSLCVWKLGIYPTFFHCWCFPGLPPPWPLRSNMACWKIHQGSMMFPETFICRISISGISHVWGHWGHKDLPCNDGPWKALLIEFRLTEPRIMLVLWDQHRVEQPKT